MAKVMNFVNNEERKEEKVKVWSENSETLLDIVADTNKLHEFEIRSGHCTQRPYRQSPAPISDKTASVKCLPFPYLAPI
ncbi:MAG: hypothetical protein IJA00_07380 [Bacteroidaceae bacterium]|nr:hypothetical protein [Bacteroidaceae bacterium]